MADEPSKPGEGAEEVERYRGMDRAMLDVAYSNRAVVTDWQAYLDRWTREGETLYAAPGVERDVRYGTKPRQRMDLFLPEALEAPVCFFLHGGYWQWNDKEGQAHVGCGLLGRGIGAAIGEYTLAPDASMEEICAEAIDQVAFLAGELARRGRTGGLYLAGISTGAHLAALSLGRPDVRGALLISGIYDLDPIRVSSLNDAIGMDRETARRFSPLHDIPAATAPVILAHGALEIPEIRRQSADYHAALVALGRDATLLSVPDTNHFSVLDQLATPDGFLAEALAALVARTS
jgi:acetyl esterase/lipase